MQPAQLLRVLSRDSVAVCLPTNAVVCLRLAAPLGEADYVRAVQVSPLRPLACEVGLGPYDLAAAGFVGCVLCMPQEAAPRGPRRLAYKRDIKAGLRPPQKTCGHVPPSHHSDGRPGRAWRSSPGAAAT